MSFKSKNLSYNSKEPAFLQALRSQVTGGGDPDRHERQIARPKRAKKPEEEDDGPTYVLEESDTTLSKAEYEALVSKTAAEAASAKDDNAATKDTTASTADGESTVEASVNKPKQAVTDGIAIQKKRKAVKIGAADDDQTEKDAEAVKPTSRQKKDQKGTTTESSDKAPKKKKRKAIALSFGDDAE